MKRRVFTLCALSAALLVGLSISRAHAERDWEYRNEESIEAAISDRLSAEIAAKFRFRDDAKEHYYTSTDMELTYEFLDWLDAGVGYRQITKLKGTVWRNENRSYIQGAGKWKWGDWKGKNRARLEYRAKQDQEEYYRFRNKLTFKSPWKWTSFAVNPYLAEEFYLEEAEGYNKNRLYIGAGLRLSERVYLDAYYLLEVEKDNGHWDDSVHVIGTKLKLKQ